MTFLIKKNIKRVIARIRSMGPAKPNAGARILMYHSIGGQPQDHNFAIRVPVNNFREQLDELVRQEYAVMTVSELLNNNLFTQNKKAIAITFDDGYKDNFTEAVKALKDVGFKATFFITTSFIDGLGRKQWANGASRQYLNWEDVVSLLRMGFEIGSHMVDHFGLAQLEEAQINFQLEESRKRIQQMTGFWPQLLSYPYGKLNARVKLLAQSAGYLGACASFCGVNRPDTDRYILKRTEINGYDIINDFRDKLRGLYD